MMKMVMAMRRTPALVVVVLALVAATAPALAASTAAPTGAPGPGRNDPSRGLVYDGTRPSGPQRPCGDALELTAGSPGRVRCTHGPDPAPDGIDVRARRQAAAIASDTPAPSRSTAAAGGSVQCYGDGSSGARVQLVYASVAGQPDQYNTFLASFQLIAAQLDDVFVRSANETGGARHPRFVTAPSGGGCAPVVAHAIVSATAAATFDGTINELDAAGYSRPDRKYLVWVDTNIYCGIAEVYNDDRSTQDNYNNGNVPGMFARVDNGCWGLSGTNLVEAHELMHSLGGVQSSAPHGTSLNHCWDNYDRMCYADGSLQGNLLSNAYCPDYAHESLYDCGHDDYFTTLPHPGLFNYLNLHWNTANNVFLGSSGSVGAWGYNGLGGLGDGTNSSSSQAQEVPNMLGAGAVGAGAYHSLSTLGGVAVAWGDNSHGQLGDGTTVTRTQPVAVTGLTNVKAVAGGISHSLALKNDGTVWAWGWNALGQLGDGTTTERHLPVQVPGLTNVVAIAAGAYHGLAVRADGTVVSWGWNLTGQLGDGTTATRLSPVPVAGLTGVTSVAAGVYHSLAVRSDGGVRAWGWNVFGQLGDYSSTQRLTPVGVAGLSGVTAVAAGAYHSLAVTNSGFVAAWGWNGHGQLGDGTTQNRDHPVAVAGLSSGVSVIAAGFYHSMAVTAAGTLVAWGWNYFGQLGDGTTTTRTTVAPVIGASTAYKIAGGGLHSLST